MVTIKDIAARLGIAPSSVARALADKPNISAETKARVRKAARELGYVANSAARVMRGEASTIIGLTIPNIENEVDARMARAVADVCRAHSFQLVLSITEDDADEEYNQVLALASARAAGMVLMPTIKPRSEMLALARRMPTVQLIRRAPQLDTDCFVIDEFAGIYDAVEHLAKLGHRRIGYIGAGGTVQSGPRRLDGYKSGMARFGIDLQPELMLVCPPHPKEVRRACEQLLDIARPTAVICGNSIVNIELLQSLGERGLALPGDISIVTYGDTIWHAAHIPPLTSIALPVRDVALAGAGSLLSRIQAGDPSKLPSADAVFKPRLMQRSSTAPIGG